MDYPDFCYILFLVFKTKEQLVKSYVLVYKRRGRNGFGGAIFTSPNVDSAIRKAEDYCSSSSARPFILFEQRYTSMFNIKEWKLR